jgi:hypothetical protein
MASGIMPDRLEGSGSWLVKRLSINVAVEDVILVGLVILGLREWAKFILRKSLVGGWELCLIRSRLKSPV